MFDDSHVSLISDAEWWFGRGHTGRATRRLTVEPPPGSTDDDAAPLEGRRAGAVRKLSVIVASGFPAKRCERGAPVSSLATSSVRFLDPCPNAPTDLRTLRRPRHRARRPARDPPLRADRGALV